MGATGMSKLVRNVPFLKLWRISLDCALKLGRSIRAQANQRHTERRRKQVLANISHSGWLKTTISCR